MPSANAATDLESIETEQVGFQAFASENKLRLLPTPWTSDKYPSTTASLLSIASGKGVLAAAGPDALVIASTDSVRQAFTSDSKEKVKPFTPQATIQAPRVSQVVFSSDESCLVISAEEGGGLAVYDTNGLLGGNKEPAFQIPTNGTAVRQILPNPSKDNSHLFGLVLGDGKLVLADLKERQLVSAASGGPVFKEDVSCACWSRLGKQIVAGLADGTAAQVDLQGSVKAVIPKPPYLMEDRDPQEIALPVTAIYWLETLDFLMIHAPINPPAGGADGMGPRNDAEYHLVHRDKQSGNCSYHRFMDPCPGFMEERLPAFHFIQRLREWLPNLDDALILGSTISSDIGLITRSKTPLSHDVEADKITHIYTTTTPLEDTRRANLPVSLEDDMSETSVIGMALDLSSKEKVKKPIPSDEEIDESATPVPALLALNHEGVLSAWHIIYNESIRQKTPYSGLVSADSTEQIQTPAAQQPTPSAFNTSTAPFGSTTPSQAQTPSQPAFGQSSTPAFGSTSGFGKVASPWGAPPASTPKQPEFGKPAGTPSFGAPAAFGQTGGMGANKPSPWGSATPGQGSQAGQTSGSVFGGNASGQSPFASFSKQSEGDGKQSASPFASFAKAGGDDKKTAPSPFGGGGFGKPSEPKPASAFGTFGKSSEDQAGKSLASPFSSFGKSNENENKPAASPFSSFGKPSGEENKPAASPFGSFAKPSSDDSKPAASPFASFGKPGGNDNKAQSSPFASFGKPNDGGNKPAASPFSTGGSFGNNSNTQQSSFASAGQQQSGMPATSSFGSTVTLSSNTGSFASGGAFGSGASFGKSSFGQPSQAQENKTDDTKQSSGLGGLGGFKLGSSFKPDGTAKDDLPKPKEPGASMFGSGFSSSLSTIGRNTDPTTPIKEEPGSTQSPKLNDIPESSTTPASPPKQAKVPEGLASPPGLLTPQGPTSDKPAEKKPAANDAPLPPDFLPSKSKKEPTPAATDDAPLPPDFLPSKPKKADEGADVPIAGSPPLDVGDERFSESASADEEDEGPPEDDDEPDWGSEDEEDDDDEEGDDDDDEDEDEEDDEEEDDRTVDEPKQLSAFESRISPASPKRGKRDEQSTTPATEKKTSYTPAGFPKPPTSFAPPPKPQSPRSPSPVRAPSKTPSAQPPSFGKISVPPGKPVERPTQRQKAPTPQPPTQDELDDEEDARIKAILEAPIEPSNDLPEFIAHHNYTGGSDKPGVAGSMEKVFRDVNSMIDTLGLNARSLQSFVDSHSHARDNSGPMTKRDLEDEEGWVFAEFDDLRSLIEGVGKDLDNGRVEDPAGKIADCVDEEKELQKLKSRAADLRKQIASRTDPKQQAEQFNAPLPSETAAQQTELRQAVQKMQKQLAEAEEAMSILRADLASAPSASGEGQAKGGASSTSNVPTVEAVTNTILKMTSMVEQRSGDVDVLEAQIRRLPRGLANLRLQDDYEDSLVTTLRGSKLLTNASRSGSPAASSTPRRGRPQRMAANGDPLGMSGMFGSRFLPSQSQHPHTPPGRRSVADLGASALGRSTASFSASTSRKKMQDVSVEEAEGWLGREKARRKVLRGLRERVERRGGKVVGVEK